MQSLELEPEPVLNDAAYAVLALCNGARSPEEVARDLAECRFNAETGQVFEAVSAFLARLECLGLIETDLEDTG